MAYRSAISAALRFWRMSQNEIVRHALNNRWLEEQGVPDVNAGAALAASEIREA